MKIKSFNFDFQIHRHYLFLEGNDNNTGLHCSCFLDDTLHQVIVIKDFTLKNSDFPSTSLFIIIHHLEQIGCYCEKTFSFQGSFECLRSSAGHTCYQMAVTLRNE